ncbi:MBL fold metallo-hydrolase [Salidesulfovibrio onnuriiensis]|uniref:MBL fold metallo-hydrolase n=1 Tax=Salidesulfovibrio onnuriiensis TaxID=2583823 RepID=UPI0011CC20A4|nr:MBL fold metallo-hydrolase [Salidesulfovibrio onnuriiensis]
MIVRCWGARGSIGVSGTPFVKYGGDTACIEIRTADDQVVIVDAGTGIRRLGNRLLEEERFRYTILFTHAHWDHIMGFPFFRPIYDSRTNITIYGCPLEQGNMQTLLSHTMSAPHFPVPYEVIKASIKYEQLCDKVFSLGGLQVATIPLSHPNKGVGYRFTEGDRSFVFLTDNELSYRHPGGGTFEDYADFARGADFLIHDGEYMPEEYSERRTWGHSQYLEALELALAAGVQCLGLFHHNQDRPDRDVDRMVAVCREIIAQRGADLECFAVAQDMVVRI